MDPATGSPPRGMSSVPTVYATDAVEIRLRIADSQLAYLELPIWGRASIPEDEMPELTRDGHGGRGPRPDHARGAI